MDPGGLLAGIHALQPGERFGGIKWVLELRRATAEGEVRTHRNQRNEDVGEDDRRIEVVATDGLHGHFDRQLGLVTQVEERCLLADCHVFGQITSRLAHHPDGRAFDALASGSTEKQGILRAAHAFTFYWVKVGRETACGAGSDASRLATPDRAGKAAAQV